jgi:hypothetical protein
MEIPPVRYARSGDVSDAYQVSGEGNPIDMVFAPGTVSHLSLAWDRLLARKQIERLSRFWSAGRMSYEGYRNHALFYAQSPSWFKSTKLPLHQIHSCHCCGSVFPSARR